MSEFPDKNNGESSKSDRDLRIKESVQFRRSIIAEGCQLHYMESPLKILGSEGAYLIDDIGNKLLDCATRMSNVGHCHPCVVGAGRSVMQNVGAIQSDALHEQYVDAILKTLPSNFEVCLFTTSGSEANDLAIQLARNYTGRRGVVVMDDSFHGSTDLLSKISVRSFQKLPEGKPDWVTVLPLPDTYRGKYSEDIYAARRYLDEAKIIIQNGITTGNPACFLSEPIFMVQGMVLPPQGWLESIYSYMKSLGSVVIADEIQLGLGRCGPKFWAFQTQDAVPDILTIGKAIANGYPLGAVVTSTEIANTIPNWRERYACESVAAAVGNSVLKTIVDEDMIQRGQQVMDYLNDKFLKMKRNYNFIGDVRNQGLIIGIDIVADKKSKVPDTPLAEKISYRLKDNNVIVANEGPEQNVLIFMPPFCITTEDADFLVSTVTRVFTEFDLADLSLIYDDLNPGPSTSTSNSLNINLDLRSSVPEENPLSPSLSCELSFSDDESRLQAEAYADMD